MHSFTAHRLRFETDVRTTIALNEHQGSALRGALFHAVRNRFCTNQALSSCQPCPLRAACAVSFLLATVDDQSNRGLDVPRPYTIEPPRTHQTMHQAGQSLSFGLTLFARARDLFPYLVLAARSLAEEGLGRALPDAHGRYRRGTLTLQRIWAENPLTGQAADILSEGENLVHMPDLPITHEQVLRAAQQRANGQPDDVIVDFVTPLRLVDNGHLARPPAFRVLMQRLLERLSALARAYSSTPLSIDFAGLIRQAEDVQIVDDQTRWVELMSYSTRLRRATPLGGLLGSATYRGHLAPFWPYLIWGQYTHVGKDAVKGNGEYVLRA